ncbi:MAG: hypothetical protein OXU19_05235 [bacterium]|nr:hypothetical protein [bacterium]
MDADLIMVACAQAVLIVGLFAWLRADMHKLGEQINVLYRRLQGVEQRLSRLEGKVDFIEGYITRRNQPEPAE